METNIVLYKNIIKYIEDDYATHSDILKYVNDLFDSEYHFIIDFFLEHFGTNNTNDVYNKSKLIYRLYILNKILNE